MLLYQISARHLIKYRKLLLKLKHYGVDKNIHLWLYNSLYRQLCEVKSKKAEVLSGVPQGTVMVLLLFLVYMKDMPNTVSSNISLFADDALVHRNITNWEEARNLQNDLDILVHQEHQQSMEFHPNKCQVLRVTNKRNIIDAEFHIHGTSLQVVHRTKYLRITTDKQLSWKDHIGSITVSA